MSRIGKKPIPLPKGVTVKIEGNVVAIQGPKGKLDTSLPTGITMQQNDGNLVAIRENDSQAALHGLARALVNNAVEGVTKGFSKKLEIVGVGYKAVLKGKQLSLDVGFANTLTVAIPDGITLNLPDPNHAEVVGIDKQLVGQVAADIRASRRPEPYKGKGVRYIDEVVRRKAGKATTATAKK